FIQIAFDGVENSVDELCGLVRGKATSDFEGLVYRDGARRGFVQEFIDSETQHVAIHQRHARNAPVLGARPNSLIDLLQIRECAWGTPGGELVRARFEVAVCELRPDGARGGRPE